MSAEPPHILIAGGGVAAVEAVAALRAFAGSTPRITLLAPDTGLTTRAASVGAPFGFGAPGPLPFDAIRRHAPFDLHRGTLGSVDPEARQVVCADGERIGYDKLLVAVGARSLSAVPGAISFGGPTDVPAVERAVAQTRRLAFVMPTASGWSLPVYELAIMAAVDLRDRGLIPEITVVTPEPEPLWVFGPEAGSAVAGLLAERAIELRTGTRGVAARAGALEVDFGPPVPAERAIALTRPAGPAISGLPASPDGFLEVDDHGRMPGVADVFAAGDATTFPLKQGGLAAQQADAAAEAIAAELGLAVEPQPFRPVLRGLLLTGGAPLYLRAALSPAGHPEDSSARRAQGRPVASVSRRALWWPPGKIAGRYLAPLLSTARPPTLVAAQLQDDRAAPAAEARDLALLLADEEAAMGDYAQALHALDAAAALAGGRLGAEWSERRDRWMTAYRHSLA
jgi:sulfide:quinone oxidoreductase